MATYGCGIGVLCEEEEKFACRDSSRSVVSAAILTITLYYASAEVEIKL
jgi:hypothetical protein